MIIDWLSFTMPYPFLDATAPRMRILGAQETAIDAVCAIHPNFADIAQVWNPTPPQRPYTDALMDVATGVKVHMARFRRECLITASGQACAQLRMLGAMEAFVIAAADTVTRIDIAHDVKTSWLPSQVLDAGISSRIKTTSVVKSTTGETVYIGSRSSDRCMRVYRYFEPHPRADKLRFELEIKGDLAKATAQQIAVEGVDRVGRGLAEPIAFQSPTVQEWFAGSSATIRTQAHQRNLAKTELWLIKSGGAAFRKLIDKGVIDNPNEWLQQHFLGGKHGN